MGFIYSRTRENDLSTWEKDVKYWLVVTQQDINPSPATIKKWDKLLNSGKCQKEIKSFCKETGWKWRPR